MATSDEKLSTACRVLEQVSAQFTTWMNDNAERIRQEKAGLDKELRRFVTQVRRLDRAVQRPMCVGVFGPSQSGKSYLISALARQGTAPLLAEFAGQQIDFIRDLNPEGGRESTGLVTRFTLRQASVPAVAPVRMRLLTQTDIIKILGNTYYADCDHSDDEPPTQAQLNETLEAIAARIQSSPVDPMTEDDVYDLQAYFERYFKAYERIRLLRHGFWERAAQLVPRLHIADRARLFAIIWGEVETFSRLYMQLYAGLQALGFAGDAYAGLDALLPREKSIIDVQSLQGLGTDSSETLSLVGEGGTSVSLPRSTVTALVAELQIVISDQPWDFFTHTDLLDFPGARSREQINNLNEFLKAPNALQGLFLRGKVAYLFERYCAEQELTSMLLCIGPSNQEVKTLPEMVYDWIATTHGATPEQRAGQPTALFLVLTKFDMEFEEKAGERSPETRWITRLESSLVNFFGKQHDWPLKWDSQGGFRNSYWLRNPNFKAKNIFDYDENGQELGIRSSERKRIEAFREAFLKDMAANRFFRDPQRAWEAAFALNDGGVSYLAENLRPVCNPDLKRQQLMGQLECLRQQLHERITPYYVSGNPEQEYQKRVSVSRLIASHLIESAGAQRFGELLRTLQVDSMDMEDIYYRIEIRLPDEAEVSAAPSIGTAVDKSKMKQWLGLGTADPTELNLRDAAALFAKEAVAEWMQDLQDLVGNASLCDYFKLPETVMAAFVKELIAAAKRLRIEERITEAVRQATGFRMRFQQSMTLPARLTANLINNYLNFLGYDTISLDERPVVELETGLRPIFRPRVVPRHGPVLSEQQSNYDQDYYTDWIRGFLDLVERNARFQGGVEVDIEANARLGELLEQLNATVL